MKHLIATALLMGAGLAMATEAENPHRWSFRWHLPPDARHVVDNGFPTVLGNTENFHFRFVKGPAAERSMERLVS
jgi:hypothetical protein